VVSTNGGLIGVEEARRLLQSIATSHAVGLRDRRRSLTEQTVLFNRLTMELVHAIIPQFAWPINKLRAQDDGRHAHYQFIFPSHRYLPWALSFGLQRPATPAFDPTRKRQSPLSLRRQ